MKLLTLGFLVALAAWAAPVEPMSPTSPSVAEAAPVRRVAPPAPRVRRPPVRRPVVIAPVRPVPAVRPWYWGRVVAGVTIGAVVVVAVANAAPKPLSSQLCWFWTDHTKTRGYWNYCTPPVQ